MEVVLAVVTMALVKMVNHKGKVSAAQGVAKSKRRMAKRRVAKGKRKIKV